MSDDGPYVGVDIGGTKLLAVVATAGGSPLGRFRLATESLAAPDVVLRQAVECVDGALRAARLTRADIRAAGLAIAGPTDFERGVVTESPNLPAWHDVAAAGIAGEALGLPAFLDNDANAAALGEHRFGAGRGLRHMVYLTVSTGIGGGIIIDGRLYRGASGSAGEFGHMVMQPEGPLCNCGNRGCLEALASGTAIEREARAAAAEGRSPGLARAVAGREMTAHIVEQAAEAGDAEAAAIIERAARAFGVGLAAIVNALNPETIVVGGGISKMGKRYLAPAEAAMRAHAFDLPARAVSLRVSALGDDAAALGAVALAHDAMGATGV